MSYTPASEMKTLGARMKLKPWPVSVVLAMLRVNAVVIEHPTSECFNRLVKDKKHRPDVVICTTVCVSSFVGRGCFVEPQMVERERLSSFYCKIREPVWIREDPDASIGVTGAKL